MREGKRRCNRLAHAKCHHTNKGKNDIPDHKEKHQNTLISGLSSGCSINHPCTPCPPKSPKEIITVSGIINLDPSQGPITGGNSIIINGYNLIYTSFVTMDGISVPFTLISNNQLQIIAIPFETTKIKGSQTIQISVHFKNGSTDSKPYTYINLPSIISLNPSSGPITGSNIITITGTNLSYTKSINFNNIPTYNFIVISDSIIQVVVPNLTGQLNVLVHVRTTSGSSNNLPYNLIPQPII